MTIPGTLPWQPIQTNMVGLCFACDTADAEILESASVRKKTWRAKVRFFLDGCNRKVPSVRNRTFDSLEGAVEWSEGALQHDVTSHQRMAIVRAHNAAKGVQP